MFLHSCMCLNVLQTLVTQGLARGEPGITHLKPALMSFCVFHLVKLWTSERIAVCSLHTGLNQGFDQLL